MPPRMFRSEKWKYFIDIYKETTPIVLVTVLAELVVGLELLRVQELFVFLPALILILPGILENRGNIASNLAQRLGTSVHLGVISWDLGFNDELKVNFFATLILSGTLSFTLSTLAFIYVTIFNIPHISYLGFLFITMVMSLGIGTMLTVITILVVLISHKLGLDPDNVTIPIIATIGDILTVASLYLVIRFILLIDTFLPIFN